ncbi:DUF4349 domain-containing protein [Gracilinema caldarium]|uniref:DUF4349 domain-containing protein n=1 Tax=Gracilinema caldarium TaxID=215591 RepID=UPI0026ED7433|nr:DUF4349 domain-containing protein [Gracilinema caldarium]
MTEAAPALSNRSAVQSEKMLASDAASPQAAPAVSGMNPSIVIPEGRKLIYTANITIAVSNVQNGAKKLEDQLVNFKAYVASQDWYENSVTYEIKVPVDQFDPLMETLGASGKVRRKNVQARDVTEYYYDLENRVKNKRILVERYQTYLKNAKTVEDLLNVERFLNDATTELESLEGNFRGLVKQVDYATINLTIEPEVSAGTGEPGFFDQLKNLFAAFGAFLQTVLVIMIGTVLYGVPLVLLAALLWWLLLGRIGLLRKLFALVAVRKK